jgi:hypothetical protein
MTRKKWFTLIAVLVLSSLSAGILLADDDDDDDEGEHETIGSVDRAHGASPRMLVPADNAAWRTECAACHTLYHPALLPARSWTQMMGGLASHFGENATLDTKVRAEILGFLVANAADGRGGLRGARIAESIPAGQTPLRFTDTMYFKRKHHELAAAVYKRAKIGSPANCMACHPGANGGDFEEERVNIPR